MNCFFLSLWLRESKGSKLSKIVIVSKWVEFQGFDLSMILQIPKYSLHTEFMYYVVKTIYDFQRYAPTLSEPVRNDTRRTIVSLSYSVRTNLTQSTADPNAHTTGTIVSDTRDVPLTKST